MSEKENYDAENMCNCGEYTAEVCAEKGGTPSNKADCSVYADLSKEAGWEKKKADEEPEYEDWGEESEVVEIFEASEYKGKKVTLNKPFRTKGGPKKFAVYVKNSNGNVIIVRFGDPNMEIKRDDPKRRKAFRDRHNCSEKKDKTKAGYWSCRQWRKSAPVEAKSADDPCQTGYEAFGMKTKNGRKVPNCVPIAEASRLRKKYGAGYNKDKDYSAEVQYEEASEEDCGGCGCGGGCSEEPVYADWNLTIDTASMTIHASTGKAVVVIKGIAFHEGVNKNGWEISRKAAEDIVRQMKGTDVTLNHPKPNAVGFSRNMKGDVDEATVGVITSASIEEVEGGWNIRYTAEIQRQELFESLESGLWMREDYGVSIGGYGVPDKVNADTGYAYFDSDFTLDHLAIVYKPAYPRANIEDAVRVESVDTNEQEKPVVSSSAFIYPAAHEMDNASGEITMTDASESETNAQMMALKASLEDAQAKLVLANALNDKHEAEASAKVEADRQVLVEKASSLGLKGHESLSSDVITSLIASWETANPSTPEVVMEEATPAVASTSESPSKGRTVVVANYLNGRLVENDETLYAKAWNAWASAFNSGIQDGQSAPMYNDLKSIDWFSRRTV